MNSRLWDTYDAAAPRPDQIAYCLIASHGFNDGMAVAETALATVISSGAQAEIVRWRAIVAAIKMAQGSPAVTGTVPINDPGIQQP
jgi:hypothetical protein